MRILLFLGTALLATLPSVLVARIWLKRKGIDPGANTVQTFMANAPTPLKAGLITMNFVNFAILCGLGWWGLSALEQGRRMAAMYRVLVAALVVSTSLVSAGCADDRGSGSDAGDGVDAGGPPPGTDGGTGGTDAGVDAGAVRSCFPECASAADCAATETGAFSADNYTCVDARCAYVGCHSDAECQETWGVTGDTYRCDTSETIPVCYPVCGSAADCAATETGAFSPDNYECAGGHCVYPGCASDAECQETYPGAPYRCDSTLEVPSCYPVCASAADCAATEAGAFSADNYECSSGHCVYLGCTSDAECQETWPTSTDTYRCR